MALIVEQRGPGDDRMEFSGSSEEDIAYAKTLWQSVQLLPPIESRLVSSDIRQRLKVAPKGGQSATITYPKVEQPQKLATFLAKAQAAAEAEETRWRDQLNKKRQEDLARFQKQKQQRLEKEKISAKRGLKKLESQLVTSNTEKDESEGIEALKELDKFDQEKLGVGNTCSTDSGTD